MNSKKLLKKIEELKSNPPLYAIGVDVYDTESMAYCLTKTTFGNIEIILAKTMTDEKKFKKEVNNLAKYFNAKIIK